jgi:hypothetical protein
VAILIDAQSVSINPGTREFEHAIDAPGVLEVRLARMTTLTPTLWAEGVSLAVRLDYSLDAGQTWSSLAAFTSEGGIAPGRFGGEAEYTFLRCLLPDAANRARLNVAVAGGRLDTLLTVIRE